MSGNEIEGLIPHAGTMCLLERIVHWDENGATLATTTHRSAANPLRRRGRLHAVHLCEYGAQAMAVHGGLMARKEGRVAKPGILVSLREVRLAVDRIDRLGGELLVEAVRLLGGAGGVQYAFRVTHRGRELAKGRAAVDRGSGLRLTLRRRRTALTELPAARRRLGHRDCARVEARALGAGGTRDLIRKPGKLRSRRSQALAELPVVERIAQAAVQLREPPKAGLVEQHVRVVAGRPLRPGTQEGLHRAVQSDRARELGPEFRQRRKIREPTLEEHLAQNAPVVGVIP